MISLGRPFSQYQLLKNSRVRSSVLMSTQVGIILMSKLTHSVIVRMQLKPSSRGRGPMKSSAMLSPQSLGIGRG